MARLIDKFIADINGEELAEQYNSSVLFQTVGWNTDKYFGRFYTQRTGFPVLCVMKGGSCSMLYAVKNLEIIAKEFFRQYWKEPFRLKEVRCGYEARAESIFNQYIAHSYASLAQASEKSLAGIIEKIQGEAWLANAQVFFSVYLDQTMCLEVFSDLGVIFPRQSFERTWRIASRPIAISFENRRKLALIEAMDSGSAMDELTERFQYLFSFYHDMADIGQTALLLREASKGIETPKKRKDWKDRLAKKQEKIRKRYDKWYATANASERKMASYLQECMDLRDVRKDAIAQAHAVMYRVAEVLFERAGIDKKYILSCRAAELKKGSRYLREHSQIIRRRQRGYSVLVGQNGKAEEEYGTYAAQSRKLHEYRLSQQGLDKDLIKGAAGSSGKAIGNIAVIKDLAQDAKKMKRGDILVTGMTRPEFITLMKKAKAIITDEGGITCHAAIVSRELGIPCVIATKIASKILKDGDMVEVDADKGVVRIIKQK